MMDKLAFTFALIAIVRCQVPPPSPSEATLTVTVGATADVVGSTLSSAQTRVSDPPPPIPTTAVDHSTAKTSDPGSQTAGDLKPLSPSALKKLWNLFNKRAPYDLSQGQSQGLAIETTPTPPVSMYGLPSGGGFDLGSSFDPFGSMFSTPNTDPLFGGLGGAFGGQQSSPNMFGLGGGSGSGNNLLQAMMLLRLLGAGTPAAATAPGPPNPMARPTGGRRGMRAGFPSGRQRFHPRGAKPPRSGRQSGAETGIEVGEAPVSADPGAHGGELSAIDNLIAKEQQRRRRTNMREQARRSLQMLRRQGSGRPFGQPSWGPYPNYPNNADPYNSQTQGPYPGPQGPYARNQWQYPSPPSQGPQPNAYNYPSEPPTSRRPPPPPPMGGSSSIPPPPPSMTQAVRNSSPLVNVPYTKHPEVIDRTNTAFTTPKPQPANQGQAPEAEPAEIEARGNRKPGATTPKPTPLIPKSKPAMGLNRSPVPDPNTQPPSLSSTNTPTIQSQTQTLPQTQNPNVQPPSVYSTKTPQVQARMDTWPQIPYQTAQQSAVAPVDNWPQIPDPYRGRSPGDAWAAQGSRQSWDATSTRSGTRPSPRDRSQSRMYPWMQGSDPRWGPAAPMTTPPADQGWGRGSSARQSWQNQQQQQQQYPQDWRRASEAYPQRSQPPSRFPLPPGRPTPRYPNPGQLRKQIQSNFHQLFLGTGADAGAGARTNPVAERNARVQGTVPISATNADAAADQADMMADRLDNLQSMSPMQSMGGGMGGLGGTGGSTFGGATSGGGMGSSMMRMALMSSLLGGGGAGIGGGAGATSGSGMNPLMAMRMMGGGLGM